jgi:hypothetical protein
MSLLRYFGTPFKSLTTLRTTFAKVNKTITIAAIMLVITATWYAWEILTFSSLDESNARWWLHFSEVVLLASTLLLTAGLFGEWSDSENWKSRPLYKLAKAAVILGVVGELLGDGGIFNAGARVQALTDVAVSKAISAAAIANEHAALLTKEAASEKLEQEHLKSLVNWRTVDAANFKRLVAELSKGHGSVDLAFMPGDPESEYFAVKFLWGAFGEANRNGVKWHVYLRTWYSDDAMFFGIWLPGPETEQVKIIRSAFSNAHIAFSTRRLPKETPPINLGNGLSWKPAPKHEAFILIGLRQPHS